MRRSLIPAGALIAAVAGSLVLAPAASAAGGDTTHPTLRQELPRTAMDEGAPQKGFGNCADIPATMDGWHFVLPGNDGHWAKLTVTFEPGGTQTITTFGPPTDKHAYVASEPGAKLVKVEAEITGSVPKNKFNLSHTCPASKTPTPSQSTGTPSVTPSTSTSTSTSPSTSASPSASASTSTPGTTPSATDSASAGATPSASASGGSSEGDLAETGSSAPVGLIAAGALALAGAGSVLVLRRRKAQQH
ncbi:LPXTG cell wall anchor domain-containing protein [Streptomyces sp. NPDC054975]